jgi:ribosomal protein S18 acetylase RimI-like enzyme
MTTPVLPADPGVPGLRFRTYRGEKDIPAIAELLSASFAANGDTLHVDAEDLRVEARHAANVDLAQDMVLGFIGDRLVARSMLTWADAMDGSARHYQSWGDVHPDWRRHGIGRAMWERNIERLRAIAASHDVERKRVLSVPWLRGGDIGGAVLAGQLGYERVRIYHHMTRPNLDDILLPPMPTGLEVRPVTSADLRPIWDAMAEAFRDHFGAEDWSEASYRGWTELPQTDPSLFVIAFDGTEIAGGVHGEIHPQENEANGYLRGWTEPVYVRRPWRRRGLASALLGRALVRLRERGMTSAQLDVDTENENQALTLYERHAFLSDRSASEWHRPLV